MWPVILLQAESCTQIALDLRLEGAQESSIHLQIESTLGGVQESQHCAQAYRARTTVEFGAQGGCPAGGEYMPTHPEL